MINYVNKYIGEYQNVFEENRGTTSFTLIMKNMYQIMECNVNLHNLLFIDLAQTFDWVNKK
jgi:hypothetical protein